MSSKQPFLLFIHNYIPLTIFYGFLRNDIDNLHIFSVVSFLIFPDVHLRTSKGISLLFFALYLLLISFSKEDVCGFCKGNHERFFKRLHEYFILRGSFEENVSKYYEELFLVFSKSHHLTTVCLTFN